MNSASAYSVKVWLTAVISAPIFIVLLGLMPHISLSDGFFIAGLGMFVGFIFSTPSVILLCIVANMIQQKESLTPLHQKIILSVTALALTALALFMLDRTFSMDVFYWGLVYAAIIVAGIWAYRL